MFKAYLRLSIEREIVRFAYQDVNFIILSKFSFASTFEIFQFSIDVNLELFAYLFKRQCLQFVFFVLRNILLKYYWLYASRLRLYRTQYKLSTIANYSSHKYLVLPCVFASRILIEI